LAPFSAVALGRAACLGALVLVAACTKMESPGSLTAPSPIAIETTAITLTIRVHARGTHAPISGALVSHEAAGYYTDLSGESHIVIVYGEETTIVVSASGYHPMEASGVLNSDERWTFYLEPNEPVQGRQS
jgi:hypothetical protein